MLVHELHQRHFPGLNFCIPLSHGMVCPISRASNIHSFSEIFLANEYGDFLKRGSLPRRWIDLGCHAGFFSAYLAWQLRRRGVEEFSALLIDADPRVAPDVQHLVTVNGLEQQLHFRPGMIANEDGIKPFGLREVMRSSAEVTPGVEAVALVPVISSEQIREAFPPPYDLLKLDIEGGEYGFIEHYGAVLSESRTVVVEWHSWDDVGAGEARLTDLMGKCGFEWVETVQPRKETIEEGRPLYTGCHLYRNVAKA